MIMFNITLPVKRFLVIVSAMTRSAMEFLRHEVERRIARDGLRPLSRSADIPLEQLRSMLNGRASRSTTIEKVTEALGLEFYIGPPRDAKDGPSVPRTVTAFLDLPEDADADRVVRAMRERLKQAAGPDQVRAIEEIGNKLDTLMARLPPPPDPAGPSGEDAAPDNQSESVVPDDQPESDQSAPAAPDADSPDARQGTPVPIDQHSLVGLDNNQGGSVGPDHQPALVETDDDQHGLVVRMLRDVKAAAGDGADVFEETAFAITIPAAALPQGVTARNVAALRAEGASMEPNIRFGDLLVIDHSDLEPREGQLYVLRTDTGLVVKRLKRSGSAWRMTSDNAHWPARDVSEDDRILGHVVWSGPQEAVTVGG